jgi:acyl-[acyl-carrier-protein]-phospholipid O-acyltransferase/long-chain-fatty-acid--[acyl-carrier-protein] ligase
MSGQNQFSLLRTVRFLPLFVTQAIGAFNDNGLRNAVTILITFELADRQGLDATTFVQAATALFILPYFLFSAIAGQLADKYDKSWMARRIKLAEVAVMTFGAACLWLENAYLFLAVLFLAGTLAAFFGPIKYGILPQHLSREELIPGNALIEMGTFVTILLGTMYGGFLVRDEIGRPVLAATIIVLSIIAFLAALRMPQAAPSAPGHVVDWNILRQTRRIVGHARERYDVFWSILGASWFWFVGTMLLVQFPVFTKDILLANDVVANIFIAVFTVGIGAGSLLTSHLLKGEVSARYVPVAAIMMSVFLFDLYFAAGQVNAGLAGTALNGPEIFFGHWTGWRVALDLLLVAVFGGLYAVPLNAIMQQRSAPPRRARIIAANNIINAIFMIGATVTAVILLQFVTARTLFLSLAIANVVAALLICRLLPQELITYLARRLFRLLYRVELRGMENFRAAGRKAVIVSNHVSLLDGPLLSAFLPERCHFAINTHMAKRWWVRPAFQLFDLLSIDPTNPLALRTLVNVVKKGRKVVIFPEGRLTSTGTLMKVYEGPGAIAHMAGARVLPVRIDGAQYSVFSRMRGKLPLRWFPRITITVLPPVEFGATADLKGARLRDHLADRLYDVMTEMMFLTSPIDRTLFGALLDARRTHGGRHIIIEDIQRNPLNYNRIVMGSFILGRRLAREVSGQKYVGVLLPNAAGCLLTLLGLHAAGKVPALLNYSTGAINMAAACTAAQVTTIVTSRKFIEAGNLQADLDLLSQQARIVYLEDLRARVGTIDKIYGLFASRFAGFALARAGHNPDPQAPAVVLFTSGSEGVPKGVVLSHRNLHANRFQAAARIDFTAQDIVFNALPMFHAFGLTGGTLLPLFAGIRTFLYPSPLHYKVIPELCYEVDATVLFGTDTFLAGYARNAHPYDFYNVRFVVAGAERVKPETRDIWIEKFGLRILEGYGATECAPVLAVNTPMHYRTGTVGRLMDGIEFRLEPVEGIEEGGRLIVRGPNVMLGYLRADTPGEIEAPPGGWYDTGDIVTVDPHRFVTILGRAKRFSKIAGEMISLAAAETRIQAAFPEAGHAVVAVPDKKKGEQLVLVTTAKDIDRKAAAEGMKAQGASELMIPRYVMVVDELPTLASGKVDYVTLNRLAREKFGS